MLERDAGPGLPPLGRGRREAWVGEGSRTARGSLRGSDRTSLGDPGPLEPESFPPPFLLPAHRKLSQPPPTYPSPPLSQPSSLSSSRPHNS